MYLKGRIRKVDEVAEGVRRIVVDIHLKADPGQFVMVWVPGVGEAPFSVSDIENGLQLVVALRGSVTRKIFSMSEGDVLPVRGPYGKGFTLVKGTVALVGGGYGLAPFPLLSKRLKDLDSHITLLLGFKGSKNYIDPQKVGILADDFIVATEDGSVGFKGLVTEILEDLSGYDMVYACGPERMAVELLRIVNPSKVEISVERLMRCGIGVCGSCVLDPLGLRVCSDGPVFRGDVLLRIEDFGRFWRGWDGRKEEIR